MHRPGPESLVWQRLADDRGLLIGGATLVLQVAEPTVGAGVEQHSNFKAEPWRRLYGTLVSLTTIVYGTTAEACAEVERLRAMHQPIRGVDSRGRRYSALRPAPWAWVHGTLAWSVIRLNEVFGTPFTDAEAEQYWREWLEVGRLLGVRDGDLPDTYAGFLEQIDRMPLEDNRSVRDVVASVSVIPPRCGCGSPVRSGGCSSAGRQAHCRGSSRSQHCHARSPTGSSCGSTSASGGG
jgi:uncharacterized protein (DUF2236 family)